MSKSRPIIFSAPMVRAILAGKKTQTRRIVKPQPPASTVSMGVWHHPDPRPHFWAFDGEELLDFAMPCPYGQPGDTLWVLENYRLCAEADAVPPRDTDEAYRIWYEADAPHQPGSGRLRPSIHMPRWASRLTLRITDVRVQRLQDISTEEAFAEGIERIDAYCGAIQLPHGKSYSTARGAFCSLWHSIYGPDSWSANPHVWALTFDVIHKNVDEVKA